MADQPSEHRYITPRMVVQEVGLRCACGFRWNAPLPYQCPVEVTVAAMDSTTCPRCHRGPRRLRMGAAHSEAECAEAQAMPLPTVKEQQEAEADREHDAALDEARRREDNE